uniref:Uncharacterized protein n=1 Tax=Branchiostoma floridae TaxID=7739 RepID=C3Z8U2_BRAFL|eukprot:XP_002595030.1 hypothetical protein BRAFLDRAFT_99651 [Branchiostoma floridae]
MSGKATIGRTGLAGPGGGPTSGPPRQPPSVHDDEDASDDEDHVYENSNTVGKEETESSTDEVYAGDVTRHIYVNDAADKTTASRRAICDVIHIHRNFIAATVAVVALVSAQVVLTVYSDGRFSKVDELRPLDHADHLDRSDRRAWLDPLGRLDQWALPGNLGRKEQLGPQERMGQMDLRALLVRPGHLALPGRLGYLGRLGHRALVGKLAHEDRSDQRALSGRLDPLGRSGQRALPGMLGHQDRSGQWAPVILGHVGRSGQRALPGRLVHVGQRALPGRLAHVDQWAIPERLGHPGNRNSIGIQEEGNS